MFRAIIFSYISVILFDTCSCWIINDINPKMIAKSIISDVEDVADPNVFKHINIIFPGTKWCGAGDIAENDDDLGVEREADMCCRDHDKCHPYIGGGETKFNLTNKMFYTRLSCDCDNAFYQCMKKANTLAAKTIGAIYFNALQTQCFRKDYPANCIKRGGWFNLKCLEYSYDKNGDPVYQWFDEPNF